MLILSDVPGDDARVVASGPITAPISTRAEAVRLTQSAGLCAVLSAAARAAMCRSEAAIPPTRSGLVLIIGSNDISLLAMTDAGAMPSGVALDGDVSDCAARILDRMRAIDGGAGHCLWRRDDCKAG